MADDTTRAAYSSDASLYRVRPLVVARPHHADEVAAVLAVCRREGVPLTSRGGGTSVAGNAIGPGVVLDFSRHMNRILSIDSDARTATVEPGAIQLAVQQAAVQHRLRFGPDPSTFTRCTIGGMVGNNACGSRTLGYGRTSDNVTELQALTGTGESLVLRSPGDRRESIPESPLLSGLRAITGDGLATIRTEFGQFGRQVSGYALEHLLPENGFRRGPDACRQRGHAGCYHHGDGPARPRTCPTGAGGTGIPRHRVGRRRYTVGAAVRTLLPELLSQMKSPTRRGRFSPRNDLVVERLFAVGSGWGNVEVWCGERRAMSSDCAPRSTSYAGGRRSMVTIRNYRRPALIVTAFGAIGLAIVSGAAPALAANTIDISGVGPANVGVDYSCEASAGVAGIKAMVGDPNANSPSATGTQNAVTCDGAQHTAVIVLVGTAGEDAPLSAGQTVQVRVALVDRDDIVVSGQAKVVSLG